MDKDTLKISVAPEEKELLKEKAKAAGMTTSKYVRHLLMDETHYPLRDIPEKELDKRGEYHIRIPRVLMDAIDEEADELGMNRSSFITELFLKRGEVKEVKIDFSIADELLSELKDISDALNTIEQIVVDDGAVYPETMDELEEEYTVLNAKLKALIKAVEKQKLRKAGD